MTSDSTSENFCAGVEPKPAQRFSGLGLGLAEVAACLLTAILFTAAAAMIEVNPTVRSGQISGLSQLQLHLVPVAVLIFALRTWGGRFPQASNRLMFAIIAGISSSIVAGGVVVALHGTRWGLLADRGDSGALARFARSIMAGEQAHDFYPPGYPHLLAWWAELFGQDPSYGLKAFQVGLTALCGPLCYLTWRLTASPAWALALGPLTMLPVLDPYKAYESVALTVFIPAMVFLVSMVRRGGSSFRAYISVAMVSVMLAGTFLTFSGWMLWSGPGLVVLMLWIGFREPGRLARLRLLAVAAVVFGLLTGSYLLDLIKSRDEFNDTYQYFDTKVDPSYVLGWLGGLPGKIVAWPVFGELGGVGAFGLLLVAAVGFAIATHRKSETVQVAIAITTSAWVVRHWLAGQLFATQSVQLYPRTANVILIGLLILAVSALRQAWQLAFEMLASKFAAAEVARRAQLAGVVVAVILLAWSQSSLADARMPKNSSTSQGKLAWASHTIKYFDGTCPIYAPENTCMD